MDEKPKVEVEYVDASPHLAPQPTPVGNDPTQFVDPSGNFPRGSWKSVDYLLHNPRDVMAYIRMDRDLWPIIATLVICSVVLAAFYGVIMGASNLLQDADVPLTTKLLQIVVSSIKVPILFLFTILIVLPPIYVSNAFVGSHNSFRQVTAMLVCATVITVTVLASMGSVALFFSLTSETYGFIKLMHVAIFAYAGLIGVGFLRRCVEENQSDARVIDARPLLFLWLLLYGFVGTQLGWILRPFIGSPGAKFQLFRPRQGNFYENVWQTILNLAGVN